MVIGMQIFFCYFASCKLNNNRIIMTMVLSVTVMESDLLTIESGPLTSEDKPLSCHTDSGKEQGASFYHILRLYIFFLVSLYVINEWKGIIVGSNS